MTLIGTHPIIKAKNILTIYKTALKKNEAPVLELWECKACLHCHYSQIHPGNTCLGPIYGSDKSV